MQVETCFYNSNDTKESRSVLFCLSLRTNTSFADELEDSVVFENEVFDSFHLDTVERKYDVQEHAPSDDDCKGEEVVMAEKHPKYEIYAGDCKFWCTVMYTI